MGRKRLMRRPAETIVEAIGRDSAIYENGITEILAFVASQVPRVAEVLVEMFVAPDQELGVGLSQGLSQSALEEIKSGEDWHRRIRTQVRVVGVEGVCIPDLGVGAWVGGKEPNLREPGLAVEVKVNNAALTHQEEMGWPHLDGSSIVKGALVPRFYGQLKTMKSHFMTVYWDDFAQRLIKRKKELSPNEKALVDEILGEVERMGLMSEAGLSSQDITGLGLARERIRRFEGFAKSIPEAFNTVLDSGHVFIDLDSSGKKGSSSPNGLDWYILSSPERDSPGGAYLELLLAADGTRGLVESDDEGASVSGLALSITLPGAQFNWQQIRTRIEEALGARRQGLEDWRFVKYGGSLRIVRFWPLRTLISEVFDEPVNRQAEKAAGEIEPSINKEVPEIIEVLSAVIEESPEAGNSE